MIGGAAAKPKKRSDLLLFRPALFEGLALNLVLLGVCLAAMAFCFSFFSAQQPGPLFFLSFLEIGRAHV